MSGFLLFGLIAIVFPPLFALALARVLRVAQADMPVFVAYGLGTGPAFLAWLIDVLLRIVPKLPATFYVLVLTVVVVSIIFWTIRGLLQGPGPRQITDEFRSSFSAILKQLRSIEKLILLLLVGLFIFVALYNLAVPLIWNDPMVYTVTAQILFRDLSAALYPFAQADPQTGFSQDGGHPLGFIASKIPFMLFAGDADTPWHKPMAAAYFFYLVVAVAAYAKRAFGARSIAYAGLLMAATPQLLLSALVVHIDPMRVYGFFLPFAFLTEFLRSRQACWLIAGAVGVAIGLHVHSGNVLVFLYIALPYFLLSGEPFWQKFRNALLIAFFAVSISGAQYFDNLLHFGSPISLRYAVGAEIPWKDYETIGRNIDTPVRAIVNGTLAPFTDFETFGPTPWLGLLGLFALVATTRHHWRETPDAVVVILVVMMYFFFGMLAVPAGIEAFYKNPRYALIVLPFMALAGSVVCVRFVDWFLTSRRGSGPHLVLMRVISAFVLLLLPAIPVARFAEKAEYVLAGLFFGATLLGLAWTSLVRRWQQSFLDRWLNRASVAIIMLIPFAIPLLYLKSTNIDDALRRDLWNWHGIARSDLAKVLSAGATRFRSNITGIAAASSNFVESAQTILTFANEVYYYGRMRSISEYDKRLLPFYRAASFKEAEAVLHKLNIGYLYVRYDYTASMSHPYLERILSDPSRISISYQNGGTLLRYYSSPRDIALASIADINFPEGLELTRDHRKVYPMGLGACDWATTTVSGIADWYRMQFAQQLDAPACETWYGDANWIEITERASVYRLAIETARRGCVEVTVYFRRKFGESWSLGAESMGFTSVKDKGRAFWYLQPPPDTDAFALALVKSCDGQDLLVTRVRIDGVWEGKKSVGPSSNLE